MKIPVIHGKMGDWGYYTGVMKFSQVAAVVEPSVDKFYSASCLSDLLQRQLTENYKEICNYLLVDKQRFFNAIVLAIYEGDPQWYEVGFSGEYEGYYNVGFLELDEKKIKIFPVDGQHRVKGIIEAIKIDKQLEYEDVPVIFIAHKNDDKGKKRTRKLFSTLNRRAKSVGENYQIALDEDDIVAIVTRELIEQNSLFQENRLYNKQGKQIPPNNTDAFTSLVALYQCNDYLIQNLLDIKNQKYKKYKLLRPEDKVIEECLNYICNYWKCFEESIPVIQEFLENDKNPAATYRNSQGGNVLFRPIGLIEFVKATLDLSKKKSINIADAIKQLGAIPLTLSETPWKGILWDGSKIINRVKVELLRYTFLFTENKENLSETEIDKYVELYIAATTFEGTFEEAKKRIMER